MDPVISRPVEDPVPDVDRAATRARARRGPLAGPVTWARVVIAGVALYAAIDTALVFLRPEFSILHNAESDYGSRGSWAWLMDLNFLLRGVLTLAAVRAIALTPTAAERRARLRVGLGLLTVWAVASGALAFFPDDPVGTRTHGTGAIHLALAFVAFLAVLVGAIVTSGVLRREARWKSVAVPMMVLAWGALVPLLLLGRIHLRAASLGGLYEKVFLGMELLWLVVVAVPIAAGPRKPG